MIPTFNNPRSRVDNDGSKQENAGDYSFERGELQFKKQIILILFEGLLQIVADDIRLAMCFR